MFIALVIFALIACGDKGITPPPTLIFCSVHHSVGDSTFVGQDVHEREEAAREGALRDWHVRCFNLGPEEDQSKCDAALDSIEVTCRDYAWYFD